jgi:hypothetical protein
LYRFFTVCGYVARGTKKRMVGMIEKIDFTKDSEYIRLFDDDDSEEFMESVYKKELGSSFEKMENGVSVGNYEEESNESKSSKKVMETKGTDTYSTKTSR